LGGGGLPLGPPAADVGKYAVIVYIRRMIKQKKKNSYHHIKQQVMSPAPCK